MSMFNRQSNFNSRSTSSHEFTMIPRADIPRSRFKQQWTAKTTFDSDYLIPIYVEEVLPGDTFNLNATIFIRMATPIVPILDNIHFDTHFFYVPNRILWDRWEDFIGGSIDSVNDKFLTIPQMRFDTFPVAQVLPCSLPDYLGIPIALKRAVQVSALPFRAYHLIYNEWYRDENLIPEINVYIGGDVRSYSQTDKSQNLFKRGKRKDYFTSALPWPQKSPGIGYSIGSQPLFPTGTLAPIYTGDPALAISNATISKASGSPVFPTGAPMPNGILYADLSKASLATINTLRLSFATGRLLEKDARGGTRYTEILRQHFGVVPPDARLQRPEYLGGGTMHLNTNPIPQTSATSTTPLGQLAAYSTGFGRHGFTKSFVEHGIVIGLISARADITYSQGIPRWFDRKTRYDFYFPSFAFLGEQPIYNRELFISDNEVNDNKVFGYSERWAEYRMHLSTISGYFTPGIQGTLDFWHLSQNFSSIPVLGQTFIEENVPMPRILAAGNKAAGQEFLLDSAWTNMAARPLPMYSVPGNLDRF